MTKPILREHKKDFVTDTNIYIIILKGLSTSINLFVPHEAVNFFRVLCEPLINSLRSTQPQFSAKIIETGETPTRGPGDGKAS